MLHTGVELIGTADCVHAFGSGKLDTACGVSSSGSAWRLSYLQLFCCMKETQVQQIQEAERLLQLNS